MDILLAFADVGTESNIIQNTLLSGIFVFLQRMSRAPTGFNLAFHTQIFLRKYLGITYFKSLTCCVCCFLLTFMWMSERTKSSITKALFWLSLLPVHFLQHQPLLKSGILHR